MNSAEREMSMSQGWETAVVADREIGIGARLDGLAAVVFI
jgi:hypothetical protein